MSCVEIKARVVSNRIDLAEPVMNKDGRSLWFFYDNDIFNNYIPAGNRGQVVHQACVNNFKYGVFVTAKVEEEEESIIQIIIIIFYRLILTNTNDTYM